MHQSTILEVKETLTKTNFKNMKLLHYLYCRFYQLMVSVGNGDIAGFASILFMTFIFGLNILTFFVILGIFGTGVKDISNPCAFIVLICLLIILYYFLVYNDKSSEIMHQYEGETKQDKIKGRIVIIAYIVLSMALLISTFFIKMMKNRGDL